MWPFKYDSVYGCTAESMGRGTSESRTKDEQARLAVPKKDDAARLTGSHPTRASRLHTTLLGYEYTVERTERATLVIRG